jgi:hypothetical protein
MSKTMVLATVFALVSFGASAGTNGTSSGNAPKPNPTAGGTAGPKSTPSVGGPSKGMVPKGGNVATQAPAPSVGGPSVGGAAASMQKTVGIAPSKPATSTAASSIKPGATAANAAKAHSVKR